MHRFIKHLKAKQAKMAKLRDELRDLESEVADEAYRVERAHDALQDAIDALSETV